MTIFRLQSLWIPLSFCFGMVLAPQCWSYEFRDADSAALAQKVQLSLDEMKRDSGSWSTPSAAPLQIDEINRSFLSLPRPTVSVEDLIELKYLLQFWRRRAAEVLIENALNSEDEIFFWKWIRDLKSLRLKLTARQWENLMNHWKHQGFSQMALMDLAKHQEGGPSFDIWSKDPDASRYQFTGEGVWYRGNYLIPGDALLVESSQKDASLYTFFTTPRSLAAHFAFFMISEVEGRRVPLVVELFEKGIRAVPLNTFLSPKFNAYVEIYRFRAGNFEWRSRVEKVSSSLWSEPHGYGFSPGDPTQVHLNCSEVGSLLLERTGELPLVGHTIPDESIVANLALLGVHLGPFLTPTDYAISPRLELVGWVDNNYFYKNIIDTLALRRLRDIFSNRRLSLKQLPWTFGLSQWVISEIQSGSFWGKLMRQAAGFSEQTFPAGPVNLLALVSILDSSMTASIADIREHKILSSYLKGASFSIHDVENDAQLNSNLNYSMNDIQEWFEP